MSTTAGTRTASPRTQPAEVALVAPLLVTVAILLQPSIVLGQPSEQSLLYDFYTSTSGWASGCSGGWSTNTTPLCSGSSSSWYGVTCSAGSVTQINLPGCGIRGTLPPQWSSLTSIQTIYLHANSISGTLPSQWSNMTNMQYLDLTNMRHCDPDMSDREAARPQVVDRGPQGAYLGCEKYATSIANTHREQQLTQWEAMAVRGRWWCVVGSMWPTRSPFACCLRRHPDGR